MEFSRKSLRNFKRFLVIVFLVAIANICLSHTDVYAASDSMKIHAIYLSNRGDAVLLESNGEYMLMDVGQYESYGEIKNYLNKLGVKELSYFISHFHTDHTGGNGGSTTNYESGLSNLMKDFKVTKVYMQDLSVCPKYALLEEREQYIRNIYTKAYGEQQAKDGIEYLKVGDEFKIGAAKGKIIGPVNVNELTVRAVSQSSAEDKEEMCDSTYVNNCSLVAMITCGKTKFLTAGDIKSEEEAFLVQEYGSALKADIFKMNHHGMSPANEKSFVARVNPRFSFAQNAGEASKLVAYSIDGTTENLRRRTAKAMTYCSRYGYTYLVGDERKSLVISVDNNDIKLYREGSNNPINSPYAWDFPVGGDGVFSFQDTYVFDSDGKPRTGVNNLNGITYYFTNGGCMEKGTFYKKNGVLKYNGWKSYSDIGNKGKRYYDIESNEMYTGFQTIDGKYYYFDTKTGLLACASSGYEKKKINSKTYAVSTSGEIARSQWVKLKEGYCYFGSTGKICTGWMTLKDKKYYLSKKTGVRITGFKEIGGVLYYFDTKGVLVKNKSFKVSGLTYQADANGKIKKIGSGSEVSISKVVSKEKKAIIQFGKNTKIDGYKVSISKKVNSKSQYSKNVKTSKGVTLSVSNLGRKSQYYVSVQSYKVIGSTKVYSDTKCIGKVKTK